MDDLIMDCVQVSICPHTGVASADYRSDAGRKLVVEVNAVIEDVKNIPMKITLGELNEMTK